MSEVISEASTEAVKFELLDGGTNPAHRATVATDSAGAVIAAELPSITPSLSSPSASQIPVFSQQCKTANNNLDMTSQHRYAAHCGNAIKVTWIRAIVACFSYLMLFTDIPRTGLAVTNLHEKYTQIEPNIFLSFGPYWYSTAQIRANETTTEETSTSGYKVFTYKYDTVSIGLRSFVKYLQLPTFPDCVMYWSNCMSDFLSSATVFKMLDSLVDTVASRSQLQESAGLGNVATSISPVAITLRSRHMWFDQLHHHLLPSFFNKPIWRTNQVLHYPVGYSSVLLPFNASLCSISNPIRPYSCDERWVNFLYGCDDIGTTICQVQMGYLWTHILERQQTIQSMYPEFQVDLTIIESTEDSTFNRGGLSYLGRRMYDILTISRVRNCNGNDTTSASCETIFIEDYRYEGEMFTSDVLNWYWVVATLRCFGQGYMYLRCIALFCGCYRATAMSEKGKTIRPKTFSLRRLRAAALMFLRIPCQVVIYGSWFPLVCYVSAHIIDSPITYEMVAHKINSVNGILSISFRDFISIATVRMRNVWFMALIVHFFTYVASRRTNWVASATGVRGVREFSITLISAVTVFAQYRSVSFRSTPIVSVNEVVGGSHGVIGLKQFSYQSNGGGNELWEGILLDVKCVGCVLVGLVSLTIAFHAMIAVVKLMRQRLRGEAQPKREKYMVAVQRMKRTLFLETTLAPYSSGILWPASALSVAWDEAVVFPHEVENSTPFVSPTKYASWKAQVRTMVIPAKKRVSQMAWNSSYLSGSEWETDRCTSLTKSIPELPATAEIPTTTHVILSGGKEGKVDDIRKKSATSDLISFVMLQGEREILQWNLERILERRPEVVSLVSLMNLTFLTDLWPLVRLRFFANQEIYWLQSKRTKQIVLMPKEVVKLGFQANTWVAWDEFEVLLVKNTQEMEWSDLLHCG